MVLRGQAIQVHLEPLDRLESLLVEVQEWKESAAAEFLQKDSTFTLLEVNCCTFSSNGSICTAHFPRNSSALQILLIILIV